MNSEPQICQRVSIGAFLRARILPTSLTLNSLCSLIFSGLSAAGTIHQMSTCGQEPPRNRTAICGSIPNSGAMRH